MIANNSPLSTLALLAAYLLTGGTSSGTSGPAPAPPQAIVPRAPAVSAPILRPTVATGRDSRLVLGYYAQFGQGDRAAEDSLERHRGLLTSVAPLWYSLSAEGTLVRRGYDRQPLFAAANPAGLPVLALVTNSGMNNAVLTDPAARSRGVEVLYRLVRDNRLAGVNIDFEGLKPSSGPALTAFMKQLYRRLAPEGFLVTMAVAARQSDRPEDNDWVAAYDYGALAPWVHYLVLMTYDQHWQTGPAGPIAAFWWVEDTLRYALRKAPPSKILLGLAGYGYDWGSDGSSFVVPAAEAAALAARHGTRPNWDESAGEATFSYWQGGVKHTVWLENSYSAELRLQLVGKYHLAGVALWRLGQEEGRFWDVVGRFRAR